MGIAVRRSDDDDARRTVQSALSLALVLGVACCVLLELNAGSAVRLVAGGSADALHGPAGVAEQYLRCVDVLLAVSLPSCCARLPGMLQAQLHLLHVRQRRSPQVCLTFRFSQA